MCPGPPDTGNWLQLDVHKVRCGVKVRVSATVRVRVRARVRDGTRPLVPTPETLLPLTEPVTDAKLALPCARARRPVAVPSRGSLVVKALGCFITQVNFNPFVDRVFPSQTGRDTIWSAKQSPKRGFFLRGVCAFFKGVAPPLPQREFWWFQG